MKESGDDCEPSSALAGQAVQEVDRRNGIDAAEAPVDGAAEVALMKEEGDGEPSAKIGDGEEPASGEDKACLLFRRRFR